MKDRLLKLFGLLFLIAFTILSGGEVEPVPILHQRLAWPIIIIVLAYLIFEASQTNSKRRLILWTICFILVLLVVAGRYVYIGIYPIPLDLFLYGMPVSYLVGLLVFIKDKEKIKKSFKKELTIILVCIVLSIILTDLQINYQSKLDIHYFVFFVEISATAYTIILCIRLLIWVIKNNVKWYKARRHKFNKEMQRPRMKHRLWSQNATLKTLSRPKIIET